MSTLAAGHRARSVAEPLVHAALFYRGADEYLAGLVPFIETALAADEPVLVAVPGENLDLLQAALGPSALRVRFRDMSVAGRNPGRIIPALLLAFVSEHAGRRVRIVGEAVWASRTDAEYPACVQHEALANVALAGCRATMLCPYDSRSLSPAVLADAMATHPMLVDGGQHTACDAYRDPVETAAAFDRPLPEPGGPTVTLEFGADWLTKVRDLVAAQATMAGLPPTRILHLQLAVNEVAVNSVKHAGGGGTLRIWCDGHCLSCEITDTGRLADPLAGRRRPPRPDAEGSRGLLLVNSLVDLVATHADADGTTVRLHVDV